MLHAEAAAAARAAAVSLDQRALATLDSDFNWLFYVRMGMSN